MIQHDFNLNLGKNAPRRIRKASKKQRILLNRLDKKIGTTPGFHVWLFETSADELVNVIISKASKECKKL